MKSANGSSEIKGSSETDFSENIRELTPARDAGAGTLVHRLSEALRREIECLVGKLMTVHKKLQIDGDRIQLDIEEYRVKLVNENDARGCFARLFGKIAYPRRADPDEHFAKFRS
jgi:hypothetical protein